MGLESGWNCHISLLSEVEEKTMMNTGACGGTTQSPKSSGKHDFHNNITINNNNVNSKITTSTIPTINHMTTTMTDAASINDIVATNCYQASNNDNENNNNNDNENITTTTTTTSTTIPTTRTTSTSTTTTTTTKINDYDNYNNFNRSLPPHNEANINSISSTKNNTIIPTNTGGCEDEDSDLNCLLPPANLESSKSLSCSAPGAISNQTYDVLPQRRSESEQGSSTREQLSANASPLGSQVGMTSTEHHHHHPHQSHDSAMEDEGHCRSLSNLTESSEQSAPVHFDMSNRAKLPRGIENIRPHLEQVDNVPLQVSLFTDCSAEATRQMLEIMQSYGEIVVCLGSSASNANSKIFLQADCSIAVEPLYPQVCQDIPAYTEANIRNNKLRCRQQNQKNSTTIGVDGTATEELLECGLYGGVMSRAMLPPANTVSPISLSRLLNSLPCSISVHREDPLSLVAIIELSRRFSTGLWNCIQYWACCASTLSAITLLCTCLSLPPLLTPLMVLYLMSLPVPLIALSLAHIEVDPKTMNRATGKKQTEYNTGVFGFVLWCYGCKFIAPVIIMILFYCAFMAHPVEIFDVDEDNLHINLHIGRHFAFFGIILHFVIISASFVHRDHSLWQRNPLRNYIWTFTCFCLLLLHGVICSVQVFHEYEVRSSLDELWPAILFLYMGCILSLLATEITKWQEIKVNTRYQRRARLDFGTKLGMNSPF